MGCGLQDPHDLEARVEAFIASAAERLAEMTTEDFKVPHDPLFCVLAVCQARP